MGYSRVPGSSERSVLAPELEGLSDGRWGESGLHLLSCWFPHFLCCPIEAEYGCLDLNQIRNHSLRGEPPVAEKQGSHSDA